MKKLIIITLALCFLQFGCLCNPYLQAGLSAHSTNYGRPEVDFVEPVLGHIEVGAEVHENIFIFARHTSSLFYYEQGAGLNEAGIYYKWGK